MRRAWWWRKPLQDHPRTKQDALPEVKTRLITEVQGKNVCLQLWYAGIPKSPASEQNPATKSLVDTGLPDLHAWKLWDDDSQFNLHIPGSSFGVQNMCGNPQKKKTYQKAEDSHI